MQKHQDDKCYVISNEATTDALFQTMVDHVYKAESLLKIGVDSSLLEECDTNTANFLLHLKNILHRTRELNEALVVKLMSGATLAMDIEKD